MHKLFKRLLRKYFLFFIILLSCLFIRESGINTYAVSQDLVKINNELIDSNKVNGDIFFDIRNSSEPYIRSLMKKHSIKRITFSKINQRISIRYSFGGWASWLMPYRYYLFSSDGYTEEYQVKSVRQSVKDETEEFYHFCQKLEYENWFYCESQS